ncbi:MAG: hypothetical protein H7Z37_00650 [Pyrinomonadaceae bacterium]|nr:hypothetical protein [Pyrinomonadaceae bacterium]
MMLKVILPLTLAAIFSINCTSFDNVSQAKAESTKTVEATGVSKPETETKETPDASESSESSSNSANAQSGFKKLTFSQKSVPKSFAYEGKILGGAKWIDANGENTLIVSQKDAKNGDGEKVQNIYGYLYAIKNGVTEQLWKIQDSATNYCDSGKGLVSPILVQDSDNDEIAENLFVYNVQGNCDVSPVSYKLMMHSGETKYAIRGATGINIPGSVIKSEKNFDVAFDDAPKSYKQTASKLWDSYVKNFNAK